MTITADTATRTNRDRDPCPPWCRVDHVKHGPGTCVGSGGGIDGIWTRAVRNCTGDRISLDASLPDPLVHWPNLRFDPRDAEDLAVIVDLLAGATPDQHGELTAAIRKAAADITEAGQ